MRAAHMAVTVLVLVAVAGCSETGIDSADRAAVEVVGLTDADESHWQPSDFEEPQTIDVRLVGQEVATV